MTNLNRQRKTAANSTFAIGGVSCSADSLVVAESFVLRIKFSGKNPAHRKSAKRYTKPENEKNYKKKMRVVYIVFLIFIFASCRHNFKSQDLVAYNCYNEGDTLVFHSSNNDLATFIISKKEIVHYGWNENTGWYSPPTAIIRYYDYPRHLHYTTIIRGKDTIKEDLSLLTIYKTKPSVAPDEEIGFEGFCGTIVRNNPIKKSNDNRWNGLIVFNIPYFDNEIKRDSNSITNIYWNDNIGIVGYDYKNGKQWTLINNPR